MPIEYRIDPDRNFVLTTATGVLTDADLMGFKAALVRDPAFRPGMKELADVSGVERLDVTPEGIWALVRYDRDNAELARDHKLAIAASADVVYGMARMYQTLTTDALGAVQVFRTTEEAARWLGIE